MPKTFDDKPCKSTLGRASREAESPSGETRTKYGQQGFLVVKKESEINGANESVSTVFIYRKVYYINVS